MGFHTSSLRRGASIVAVHARGPRCACGAVREGRARGGRGRRRHTSEGHTLAGVGERGERLLRCCCRKRLEGEPLALRGFAVP